MPDTAKFLFKPTHKSITHYYATLESLAQQNVSHEMGLRRAFQELLAETAKLHDWTLVNEDAFQTTASSPGKGATVRPDATLRDKNALPRGFWESKDTADSLSKEIARKSAKGYSLANTIFEDTQTAILYQNKKLAFTADLTDPQALSDLLNQLPRVAYNEPAGRYSI